jgi:hypothetical protein
MASSTVEITPGVKVYKVSVCIFAPSSGGDTVTDGIFTALSTGS